jgi:hypothetical protein
MLQFKYDDDSQVKPEWEARLQDLLSTPSRDKRRLLLMSSTVALVIVVLGLFPTKIEAFGISFESRDTAKMMLILGGVTTYAFAGFLLYAWSDLHVSRRRYESATTGFVHGGLLRGRATLLELLNYYLRFSFEFIMPVMYGSYALFHIYETYKKFMPSDGF